MMNNKNSRKKQQQVKNNDYLNFIRRNQQIVKEFKVISEIEKKGSNIYNISSQQNDKKYSKQTRRYQESYQSPLDFIKSENQSSKRQIALSLKYMRDPGYDQLDTPIATRRPKAHDLIERILQNQAKIQIKTRNLSIPSQYQSIKDKNQFGNTKSNIKFPKILTTNKSNMDDDLSSSQSISIQKQILSPAARKKSSKTNMSQQNERKIYSKIKYAPIQLDNRIKSKEDYQGKIKSMKFTDMPKAKLNGKLIRTYYDYENLMELKDRVTDLMPTFKPLQPRKREKVQIIQIKKHHGELQKYLEANKIENPNQIKKVEEYTEQDKRIYNVLQKNQQLKILEEDTDKYFEIELKKSQSRATNIKSSSQSPIKQNKSQKQLILPTRNQQNTVYQNKIQSYREFLFLVNFAHRIFDPIILTQNPNALKNQYKYKYYLGKGNNSLLIKSLLKRRFWWVQTDDIRQANFVWTQLKVNNFYQFQKVNRIENKFDKLDQQHPYKAPKQKKSKNNGQSPTKKQQNKTQGGILRGILGQKENKIFTNADLLHYTQMLKKPQKIDALKKFSNRLKYLPQSFLKLREYDNYQQTQKKLTHITERVHNHFANNFEIGNKKAMFYHLRHYYQLIDRNPYQVIPLTFHIKNGVNDPEYVKFMKQFKKIKAQLVKAQKSNSSTKKLSKNVWIVKPGQISNRGNGITVIDEAYEINSILKSKNNKHANGQLKTYIVQKYIEKPMLYKNRKFDIRHYMLISGLHGRKRAYWFSEGYIRTSCYQYDLEEVGDVMIHLTNDAIQQNCNLYGKYEEGNKLSYAQFQRYLDSSYPQKKYSFIDSIYPKMREIASDAVKATYLWMDPQSLQHNFQIFGLDFMIDSQFNVWLIQINTNPCLELSSSLLSRIIPNMVQHSLRLSLDPIFPPPSHYHNTIKYLAPDTPMQRLQFQLIFDENRDGKEVQEVLLKAGRADCGQIEQEDQTYENDGKQIDIGGDLD